MNKFTTFLKSMEQSFKSNKGDIYIGVGLGLIPVSIGLAIFGTFKAVPRIEERKKAHPEEKPVVSVTKACYGCYIPTTISAAGAYYMLIAGMNEQYRKEAAVATAFTITKAAFDEYKRKVVEKIGEKSETEIRDSIAKDHYEANPPANNGNVYIASPGEILCYDELSGRYFHCKINRIEKAVNDLNRRMLTEMYISVNEFYYEIGQPATRIGDMLGWNIDDGNIELQYSYCGNEDGEPCLVIGFTVAPNEKFCHLA